MSDDEAPAARTPAEASPAEASPADGPPATGTPAWASALRRRRQSLGKSQTRVVADAGGPLNQSEVSRLERGLVHPTKDLGLERFFAYLRALHWTPEAFAAATGLALPFPPPRLAEALDAARRLEVRPEWLALPVRGVVAAGAGDADRRAAAGRHPTGAPSAEEADDADDSDDADTHHGVAYVPRESLRARGADPEHVRVYLVNGDCMISGEAQRVQKNIAPGDFIAVDTRRSPNPGEVVVAWWPDEEKMVVKRYKVEAKHIVLYPVNPSHPNLVLPDEEDVYLIGAVVWRGG